MPHLHLILFQCLNAFGDLHLSDNATKEGAKWSGELLCAPAPGRILLLLAAADFLVPLIHLRLASFQFHTFECYPFKFQVLHFVPLQ